jgi:RND family efflux transporter MFP subunit
MGWLHTLKTTGKWIAGTALMVMIIANLAGVFEEKILPGKIVPAEAQTLPDGITTTPVLQVSEPLIEIIPGTVQARLQVSVSSRILATIEDVLVRAGDTITSGSTLIQLDSRDLEKRENQSQQELQSAQASFDEAQSEYERVGNLYKEQVIPKANYDAAERGYRVALARQDRAHQALEETQIARSYAAILSPIDGRVIDRLAEPGDTAVPGQPLLKLYDPASLRLEAYVRESLATHLKRGDIVVVSMDALDAPIKGTVEEIVPEAEPGSRSFLFKIALPSDPGIYPGMFGRVTIPSGTEEVLYLSETGIHSVGQLTYVQVVGAEGTPQTRFIQTGSKKRDGQTEVISGLSEGEQVVVPVSK